jgi:pyruvate/2-oxoglutarate/acetoin dehydrogenase E1 component
VHEALKAAAVLSEEKIDIEVLDLISISPWDRDAVFNSVSKTHRLVVAHEAVKQCGIGAEIVASVCEEIMDELDGPVQRVGAPFVPVPFSMEQNYLPNANDIVGAVKRALDRSF